jgi:hypothetical protein
MSMIVIASHLTQGAISYPVRATSDEASDRISEDLDVVFVDGDVADLRSSHYLPKHIARDERCEIAETLDSFAVLRRL